MPIRRLSLLRLKHLLILAAVLVLCLEVVA
jgi:hypothetical protein